MRQTCCSQTHLVAGRHKALRHACKSEKLTCISCFLVVFAEALQKRAAAMFVAAFILFSVWMAGGVRSEWCDVGVVVWDEVQTCILPSRCHCHSLSLAPVNPDWL